MSDIAIRAVGLSKKYRIGQRVKYKALRDVVAGAVGAPMRWLRRGSQEPKEPERSIWALKDVSFDIGHGETVGIIGRNGAGKSTLLKLLSRITAPSSGEARIFGRVGSLLEVGTGFHPELTGRENIFLNGAILGMRKREIERKLDEIIDFAEIEKFIDTPVKHYSSGMYVRLAFSVAAHLEPEILVVDEVLAVGDIGFQKKCLGKLSDISSEGRTVLLVSHNLSAVSRLCRKAFWIDGGQLNLVGTAGEVVGAYLAHGRSHTGEARWNYEEAPGDDRVRLRAVRIVDGDGETSHVLDNTHPFFVELEYDLLRDLSGFQIGFWLLTAEGTTVFVSGDREDVEGAAGLRMRGRYTSRCKVPGFLLNSGEYSLSAASDMRGSEIIFVKENALGFTIELTQIPLHSQARPSGILSMPLEWKISKEQGG
ncbi:MAG: ABC transporter ATP-binding protein [Syntrophobacteraceae bacterium]|nr:ABC transporter ATP-binding protein [Syntrophobacteraceae bacterium]